MGSFAMCLCSPSAAILVLGQQVKVFLEVLGLAILKPLGMDVKKRPCLLTPNSGGNKSHERAIDTDSAAIRATEQLLTPTSAPAFLPTALLQAIIQSPIYKMADKLFRLLA